MEHYQTTGKADDEEPGGFNMIHTDWANSRHEIFIPGLAIKLPKRYAVKQGEKRQRGPALEVFANELPTSISVASTEWTLSFKVLGPQGRPAALFAVPFAALHSCW
jgi:hypothetical protein